MKLRDLEARLIRSKSPFAFESVETVAEAHGVDFRCPLPGCGHHVRVYFQERGVPTSLLPAPRWKASGSTLDDLTLDPSIHLNPNAPAPKNGEPDVCRWHGWVRNGDAS